MVTVYIAKEVVKCIRTSHHGRIVICRCRHTVVLIVGCMSMFLQLPCVLTALLNYFIAAITMVRLAE